MTKRCTKCGSDGPFVLDKRYPDGLGTWCKACKKESHQKWLKANPEKTRAYGRKSTRKYPEKNRERARKWGEANQDKMLARVLEWQKENKDKRKVIARKYREANREKLRESSRKYTRGWRAAHPEKVYEYSRSRRASKLKAEGNYTVQEWKFLQEEYAYHCAYCNRKPERLEADHVIPLSRGGTNDISNIVPACKTCNASKNDTPLLVWMLKTREYRYDLR